MSDVLEILKRGDSGLEALLRAVLLDSENKVPSDRLRIVGAVADGAVMESGSNSNGEWIRLANGTQVCYGTISPIIPAGSTAVSSDNAGTYPAAFVSAPSVVLSGKRSEINLLTNRFVDATMLAVRVGISSAQSNDFSANCCYIAIGKWK